MLIALSIKNFALIQELSIEFNGGFNILSGETGAGKSILIDTIDYVLGGKFSKDLIRYGEDKTFVEAVFTIQNLDVNNILNELGIEDEETLIISRETTISGKSIVRVNGKIVSLSQLKRLREKLLDIHGQHQNQNLLNRSNHILYLDEFCSDKLKIDLIEFEKIRDEYIKIQEKIKALKGNENREKLIDYLKFQIEDIEKGNLKIGEEESLKEEFNLLSNAEKISLALSKSYTYLNGKNDEVSALEGLSKAINELSHVENHLDKIKDKRTQIEEAFYIIEEATREIRDIADEIYYDENELAKINERIYEISIYKKKYGNSVEDILENLKNLKEEYEELINSEEIIIKLQNEIYKYEEKLKALGSKIHKIRLEAAKVLEVRIKEELSYVGLEKARIEIEVILTDSINTKGYDEVQFLISANPGEPLKSLEKVLSGGELSRIMLALKCVFVDKDKIPTLIFDEIDTGISGNIGKRVGEKMYEVSTKHQVLCITHLPQIAALSDNHFFVSKKVHENKTYTKIKILSKEEKIQEIAKMIGGDEITEVNIENASQMVNFAEIKKEEIKKTIKLNT